MARVLGELTPYAGRRPTRCLPCHASCEAWAPFWSAMVFFGVKIMTALREVSVWHIAVLSMLGMVLSQLLPAPISHFSALLSCHDLSNIA